MSLAGLIAEIGGHHFGSIEKAKELIRVAKESGADWVKMQALDTDTFTGGSMPPEFYRQCDLGLAGYLECEAYGEAIGIRVFFSVFGPKYDMLRFGLSPYKIAGSQFKSFAKTELDFWNRQTTIKPVIVSVPEVEPRFLAERIPAIKTMDAMYVGPYNEDPKLALIGTYTTVLGRQVGYSDHTAGSAAAEQAIRRYGCRLVEKHFNLDSVQRFDGQVYRDSLHAADPSTLEQIAKTLSEAR